MRITHRYLGYFLAGIMAVYAVSGVLLIYRDTDFLKKEKKYDKVVEKNLDEKALGKELRMKGLEVEKTEGTVLTFKQELMMQQQDRQNTKELPFVLDKMTKLHKSQSKDTFSVKYFSDFFVLFCNFKFLDV
jgi:ribosomal 30S subunit maturation factor RimM